MPSWSTIRRVLDKLEAGGLAPHYQPLPARPVTPVDWARLPPEVDPTGGLMDGLRAQRKRWQVESLIRVLRDSMRPGSVIVDFGASSGNLGLPVAACFPESRVFIVDKKPRTVDIARNRIARAGLTNVALYPGFVREVTMPFDVGLGLHLCGDGTDRAQALCMDRGATYVMAPCCLGFIKRSPLTYPRSRAFAAVIDRREYDWLAGAADWTHRDGENERHRRGRQCMGLINADRNYAAQERGYRVAHYTMVPPEASPKNEIIVGIP